MAKNGSLGTERAAAVNHLDASFYANFTGSTDAVGFVWFLHVSCVFEKMCSSKPKGCQYVVASRKVLARRRRASLHHAPGLGVPPFESGVRPVDLQNLRRLREELPTASYTYKKGHDKSVSAASTSASAPSSWRLALRRRVSLSRRTRHPVFHPLLKDKRSSWLTEVCRVLSNELSRRWNRVAGDGVLSQVAPSLIFSDHPDR